TSFGQPSDRRLAAGLARVHVGVAAELRELDEPGEPVLAGEGALAACFAQLGWHPVEAEPGVDLRLGLAGHAAGALEQAVLVELVPLLLSDLAQLDVVRLRPGEVLQRRAV